MTVALIDSAAGIGTTSAIDTTGANFIVVFLSYDGVPATICSDSKGNTWTALTLRVEPSNGMRGQFFYCESPTVGSGHTFATGNGYASVFAAAFSGVGTASFDTEVGGTTTGGSSTSVSSGPITPSQGNSLLIYAQTLQTFAGTSTAPTISGGDGWTQLKNQNAVSSTSYGGVIGYQLLAVAAAKSGTATWSNAAVSAGGIAVFRSAAGAPPVDSTHYFMQEEQYS